MTLKAIIIDDELRARNVLNTLITENIEGIEIVGMAEDVPNGVKLIHKESPDLVFLDIEMPEYSGFQLLDFFENITFQIIFTTAYSDYALQAFQVSAIDYLMKPIQFVQLEKAIEKAKRLEMKQYQSSIDTLKLNLSGSGLQKITLAVSNGLEFVSLPTIIYLEAAGSYTTFHLINDQKIVVSKKIKEFESMLTAKNRFFRPHRSYIVNLDHIKSFVRSDGGYLKMQNGATVSLSREAREAFLKVMSQ